VIIHPVVLLEAAVVFFVDDDEAEVGVGEEEPGAGADDDARFTGGDCLPQAAALGAGQCGVPFDRRAAEAGLEAAEELARQCDFGKHNENLPALLQSTCNRLEVDFGLTGAGYAIEQSNGEVRSVYRGSKPFDGALLGCAEFDRRVQWFGARTALLRDRRFDETARSN